MDLSHVHLGQLPTFCCFRPGVAVRALISLSPTGNAIQAFGNGTDVNLAPKSPSFPATQAPRLEKTPSLPDDLSDSTSLGTSVITTCTSVQVRGGGKPGASVGTMEVACTSQLGHTRDRMAVACTELGTFLCYPEDQTTCSQHRQDWLMV